jgi:tetratricopeptide (TPR) repeat protein
VQALVDRAAAYAKFADFTRARPDLAEALRLDPSSATAYLGRGELGIQQGEYDRARADFDEAIRLDPFLAPAYGARGLLNAACADRRHRNAAQTVRDTAHACDLTAWSLPPLLNAHAAALAEAARFDEADDWQEAAVMLLPSDDLAASDDHARLTLYRSHTPYRLPAASGDMVY